MNCYWDAFLTAMREGKITAVDGGRAFLHHLSPRQLLQLFFKYLQACDKIR